jgi:hypothetical protein
MEICKRAVWAFASAFYRNNRWVEHQGLEHRDLIQMGWELALRVYPRWRKRKDGQELFTYLYGRLQLRGRQLYRNYLRRVRATVEFLAASARPESEEAQAVEELARGVYLRASSQLSTVDRELLALMLFPSPQFLQYVRGNDTSNPLREIDITCPHYAKYLGVPLFTIRRKVPRLRRLIKEVITNG